MAYTLLATGDLMLQRPPARSELFPVVRGPAHVFANLEEALTDGGERADKLVCLKGSPALAAELKRSGVSVVTLANNHCMDFGTSGLRATIAALARAGVPAVGAGEDLAASLRPATLDAGGLRVAFVGLSCTMADTGAGVSRPGIAPVRVLTRFLVDHVLLQETPGVSPYVETVPMPGDTERAAAAVAAAKRSADLVIVGIHWGVPIGWVAANQDELATYQQPLGRALIDAGADAVIGHHPHVLHGVEVYRGRPIYYSLGNFLFHSLAAEPVRDRTYPPYSWRTLRGEPNRYGGLARVHWDDPGRGPDTIELVPVWLDDVGEPGPADAARALAAIGRVAELSKKFGTACRAEGGVAVLA